MRVFQVMEEGSNAAVPGSRTWYRNLYEPLIDLGHDVVLFSAAEGRAAMQADDAVARTRFSEKVLDAFRAEHSRRAFDLVFTYLMDGMVDASVIDEIQRSGVPTCNFSCNNTHQFDLVDELSPHFDYNLHSEKDAAGRFRSIGATPIWWPMASNPNYFKPQPVARTVPVSFVGANYALRARYCAYLLDRSIDVQMFGPGWQFGSTSRLRGAAKRLKYWLLAGMSRTTDARTRASAQLGDHDFRRSVAARFPAHVHGPISDDELVALYSGSQISLGFLEVYDGHDPTHEVTRHLHLREFEAPMSGALYCTGYMDELVEMFEPDKEVIVYRNQYELFDKVRFYLDHPSESERIRLAGRQRALHDHTYHRRFQQLFEAIGLN